MLNFVFQQQYHLIPPPGMPIFNEPPPQYNIYDVPRHVVSAGEAAASSRPRVILFLRIIKLLLKIRRIE